MSDALFLPRELFADLPAAPGREGPAPREALALRSLGQQRRSLGFDSGAAVADDLIRALGGIERRRTPRAVGERGVDLYIG